MSPAQFNDGLMGQRVRAYDWAATALGPSDHWPQSLRTALSIMLSSAFPSYLAWGPELTSFYNDAYIPIMGDKPDGLGQPFREVWAEVWDTIGPITDRAMRGEASYYEDLPLTLVRRGYPEQTWFSFSYSPIRDETGGVGGVLCTVLETTPRVRAERALRESEARLEAAIDLVGLSPYSWNPQTGALEWGSRLKAMWGLSPDAHVDEDVWKSGIHPEDRARVEAAVAACSDQGGTGVYDIEYRVIGIGDGVERWVSTHGRTIFEQGKPVEFFGAALDVTDRKRAETALRESENRLAATLEQLPVGVGLSDLDGTIRLSNRAFQRYAIASMPSRDQEQAARWRAYDGQGDLISADQYPGARALRGEAVLPGTDFLFSSAGRESWTRVSAAPFRNPDQDIVGAIIVVEDIDRQKRAEENFREFALHSTNVLWIVDAASGTLEYVSPAFETLFGTSAASFLQNSERWFEVIHPEDRARVQDGIEQAGRGETSRGEFRILRTDGAVRWVRNCFFPIQDEQGRVRRAGGIAEDITRHEGKFAYVVAEDEGCRHELIRTLRQDGYDVRGFSSAAAFLELASALSVGPVVLDLRCTAAGGLKIPRELKARQLGLPVVVLAHAEADLGFGVQAMRAGAVDVLAASFSEHRFLSAVASAAAAAHGTEKEDRQVDEARARIAEMSVREREVLGGLIVGRTNKEIAREIGLSPRTVEIHRAHVMQRLGAQTLSEAVLMASAAGLKGFAGNAKS